MAINRGFQYGPTQTITKYNPEQVGGGAQTSRYNSDGTIDYLSGGHSDEDEVNRYRGLGEAAAARQAYQANWAPAQADEANGVAARQSQLDATGLLQQAAQGGAPSAAAIMGQQAGGQSLANMLGASAGARGMAAVAAQRQAQAGMGAQQLGNVAQYAGMRGNEMAQAQNSYGAAGGAMRTGDYAQQGLAGQRAQADAAGQFAQTQLNDQAQTGYEQMGINTQQAQVNAGLRQDQMQTNQNVSHQAKSDADDARHLQQGVGLMQAVGTLGTGSDERVKQNVRSLERRAAISEVDRDRFVPMTDDEIDRSIIQKPERKSLPGEKFGNRLVDKIGDAIMSLSDERAKEGMHREGDMGHALAQGFEPFEYEYKPDFASAERQEIGEKNVGPMAQNMAKNPVTGSAVKQAPNGLLMVDIPKATKVNSAGIGYLAARQQQLEAELARMKGGR